MRLAVAALSLTLAACSPATSPAPEAAAPEAAAPEAPAATASVPLSMQGGMVLIPAGDRDVTAGFGTLAAGDRAVTIVEGDAAFASAIELHTHSMDEEGRMAMRKVDAFTVPANGVVELKRGGDHLMFFGIDRSQLVAGETVDVTLKGQYEDGTEASVVVTLTVSEL